LPKAAIALPKVRAYLKQQQLKLILGMVFVPTTHDRYLPQNEETGLSAQEIKAKTAPRRSFWISAKPAAALAWGAPPTAATADPSRWVGGQ